MKKILLLSLILFLILPFQAQAEEYRLSVTKVYGFNNGQKIRGTFKASLIGDETQVGSVTFLIDGQTLQQVSSAPFAVKFDTGSYANGEHLLSAEVVKLDGTRVVTAQRTFRFLSAEEEKVDMGGVMLPMLGLVGALLVAMLVSQVLLMRKRQPLQLAPGAARTYGLKGGSICPRCKRPFGLHWWSINLLAGVYDRCDFCGKWAFYRRRSPAELAAAEAAEVTELAPKPTVTEKSEEEKLRERLDDSKYTRG